MRGKSPEETAIDLVIEDHSTRRHCLLFDVGRKRETRIVATVGCARIRRGSYEPKGVFLKFQPHPRAYGNVARFLGKYVRDEKVASLSDAIRRLSALPAHNLKLRDRGELTIGDYADIVVFDPTTITDHATFNDPQQFATGVRDVVVNGVQVLKDGEHTGAKPGQVVRGPGWTGWHTPAPRHRSIATTAIAMERADAE